MRGVIRDYVRMRNIKRVTAMELGQLITPLAGKSAYLKEEEIWGDDPVHFTPKGLRLESIIYEKRAEEKEEEAGRWQRAAKRPKQDLTKTNERCHFVTYVLYV